MQPTALCLVLIGTGLLAAQHRQSSPPIRSISVKVVSTSQEGLAQVDFAAISAAGNGDR